MTAKWTDLQEVPRAPQDVIAPNLEPGFQARCLANLLSLRSALTNGTSNRPVTFFVGAGVSCYRPAGLPTAIPVLLELFTRASRLCPDVGGPVGLIRKQLGDRRELMMENVLQHLKDTLGPVPLQAARVFEVPESPRRYNVAHEFLARWLGSERGLVVTTNLDCLIEHAWKDVGAGTRIRVIRTPNEFGGAYELASSPCTIFKLHGSADDPDSCMVTLRSVASELHDARAQFLEYVLRNHSVCFVGWRGADLDVVPCMRRILQHIAPDAAPQHYWVFLYREGRRAEGEYIAHQDGARELFPSYLHGSFLPVVTQAEHLFAWLMLEVFQVTATLPPATDEPAAVDLSWLDADLRAAGEMGVRKLVGFALRCVGQQDASQRFLDGSARRATLQASQLLQESAQGLWQLGKASEAKRRVGVARRLLREVDEPLALALCEYGAATMTLDAKRETSLLAKASAMGHLLRLHWRFRRLARRPDLSPGVRVSAGHGVLLCCLYEAKSVEGMGRMLSLDRLPRFRRYVADLYRSVKARAQDTGDAATQVDAMRHRALVLLKDDPTQAEDEISDALRLAQEVGSSYYDKVQEARDAVEKVRGNSQRRDGTMQKRAGDATREEMNH